jgi:hypothetical protein
VVFKTIVWSGGGFGGVAKSSVSVLNVSVGSGAVTVKLTGTLSVVNPVAAICTLAAYVPTGNPLGFTRTVKAAGRAPDSGDADSHSALPGLIVTTKAAELDPDFTDRAFPEGRAVPACQVKASDTGVGLSVACPKRTGQTVANIRARRLTVSPSAHSNLSFGRENPYYRSPEALGICR